METVYVETSVVSYLVSEKSRDPVTASRQQLTQEWREERRPLFACVISQQVIAEAAEGSSVTAAKRMKALREMPLLSGDMNSSKLVEDLLTQSMFPPNARADANHLAIATCASVDYLLTWNYRHLANAVVLRRLEKFLDERGLRLPRVCTPEELMGSF